MAPCDGRVGGLARRIRLTRRLWATLGYRILRISHFLRVIRAAQRFTARAGNTSRTSTGSVRFAGVGPGLRPGAGEGARHGQGRDQETAGRGARAPRRTRLRAASSAVATAPSAAAGKLTSTVTGTFTN